MSNAEWKDQYLQQYSTKTSLRGGNFLLCSLLLSSSHLPSLVAQNNISDGLVDLHQMRQVLRSAVRRHLVSRSGTWPIAGIINIGARDGYLGVMSERNLPRHTFLQKNRRVM